MVIPQLFSFSRKRVRLRGFPSYMGGLLSLRSSHTAASAALETMNDGCEINRRSHRHPPPVPTAAESISFSKSKRLRRNSSRYASPTTPRRTPYMYSSSSRRLQLADLRARLIPKSSMASPRDPRGPSPCPFRAPHSAALRSGHMRMGLATGRASAAWAERGFGGGQGVCGSPHSAICPAPPLCCAAGA